MAQKERDFRENELQTLIGRFTMDKSELPSNIHHKVGKGAHPSAGTMRATIAEKSAIAGKVRKIPGQQPKAELATSLYTSLGASLAEVIRAQTAAFAPQRLLGK